MRPPIREVTWTGRCPTILSSKLDQQGQIFGRQAYVGLNSKTYGMLRLGRQYGAIYAFMASVDPIGVGNYTEILWQTSLTGIRYDNTVDYFKPIGPVSVEAQYSSGNQAGESSIGRTLQLMLVYDNGALRVGGAGQQSRDANGRILNIFSFGGKYTLDKFTFYSYYINSLKQAGFAAGASGTADPLANTSLAGNAATALGANTQTGTRRDAFILAGLTYRVTPALRLIGAYAYDHVSNVSPGNNGALQSGYLIVDYSLSVRTDVYAEADRSHLSGASKDDPNSPLPDFGGPATRWGTSVGIRHRF